LNLPKTPGLEVLERIRASPLCAEIPIAIFSSSDAPEDRRNAARLGASRYIKKPTNLDDFLKIGSVLREMLHQARG
jgi:CheY-like chemotaxis protein